MPLGVYGTNCYLVAQPGSSDAVVIDPGDTPETVARVLDDRGWSPRGILVTHGHIDHIGGVGTLVHGTEGGEDIEVRIHDDDRHMLLDPIGTSGQLGSYLEGLDLRPPEVIYGIDDGERIRGCGMTFTAIHTPGHTRGSVCFGLTMDGQPPILFSGDHLFAGSIGRTDLPGGSMEQLMVSMAEKILPLPDETQVLPGHGPTTSVGHERATNPFLVELRQRGGRW